MIGYKKIDKPDYKWLRVTTSDSKWLRMTTSDYEPDYEWLQATARDYERLQARLRVTTSQTMIKMPQLWVKRIFTS